MLRRTTAADFIPVTGSLNVLRQAATRCQGCDLYQCATQVVFGEGSRNASIMLVGEAPGDEEDREGHPFSGPAGWLLDSILESARIERESVYITNAVKHFRWEQQGKNRVHKRPAARHLYACRPWLEAELDIVRPDVLVCLGATAAQQFLGRSFRVTRDRGKVIEARISASIIATHHPAAILRNPFKQVRDRMRTEMVLDLRTARRVSERLGKERRISITSRHKTTT